MDELYVDRLTQTPRVISHQASLNTRVERALKAACRIGTQELKERRAIREKTLLNNFEFEYDTQKSQPI